jgi:hypothetical protein
MNEYVQLVASSSIIINRIAFLLDNQNIQTLIKDMSESARLAGFGIAQNDVELHVHQADLERAQKILAEFNEGKSL